MTITALRAGAQQVGRVYLGQDMLARTWRNSAVGSGAIIRTVGGTFTHTQNGGIRRSDCTAQSGYSDAWHIEHLMAPQGAANYGVTYFPITPGQTLQGRLLMRSHRPRTFIPQWRFYDAAGAVLSALTTAWGSRATSADPTVWTEYPSAVTVVPAGAAYVIGYVYSYNASGTSTDMPTAVWYPGEWVEWKEPMVVVDSPMPDFFDGDTPDTEFAHHKWTGAQQASPSTALLTSGLRVGRVA